MPNIRERLKSRLGNGGFIGVRLRPGCGYTVAMWGLNASLTVKRPNQMVCSFHGMAPGNSEMPVFSKRFLAKGCSVSIVNFQKPNPLKQPAYFRGYDNR